MTEHRKSNGSTFRAGAGAIVMNASGEVLALERVNIPDAWQLPQGGLRPGEAPEEAVYRELYEETGLEREDVELVDVHEDWLAYELPEHLRRKKLGRGQVHKWFLFRLTGPETRIRLDLDPKPEFRAWRWMRLQELTERSIEYRKGVYSKLAARFGSWLS